MHSALPGLNWSLTRCKTSHLTGSTQSSTRHSHYPFREKQQRHSYYPFSLTAKGRHNAAKKKQKPLCKQRLEKPNLPRRSREAFSLAFKLGPKYKGKYAQLMGNLGRTVWGQGNAKCTDLKAGSLAHLGIERQPSFLTPWEGFVSFSLLRTGPDSLSQQSLQ